MKKFILILLLAHSLCGYGQIIQEKLFVEMDLSNGNYSGDELTSKDEFIFPQFYPNLSKSNGWHLRGFYNLSNYLDVGVKYSSFSGSGWSLENQDFYDSAKVQVIEFGPIIRLHSRQEKVGFLNRVTVFLQCAPYFGISDFNLGRDEAFESSYNFNSNISKLYGMELGAGAKVFFNQTVSLVVHYDYSMSFFSSDIIVDNSISRSSINVGLSWTLLKDKKFLYK